MATSDFIKAELLFDGICAGWDRCSTLFDSVYRSSSHPVSKATNGCEWNYQLFVSHSSFPTFSTQMTFLRRKRRGIAASFVENLPLSGSRGVETMIMDAAAHILHIVTPAMRTVGMKYD